MVFRARSRGEAALQLGRKHENEIGVEIVPARDMVYLESLGAYVPEEEAPADERLLRLARRA